MKTTQQLAALGKKQPGRQECVVESIALNRELRHLRQWISAHAAENDVLELTAEEVRAVFLDALGKLHKLVGDDQFLEEKALAARLKTYFQDLGYSKNTRKALVKRARQAYTVSDAPREKRAEVAAKVAEATKTCERCGQPSKVRLCGGCVHEERAEAPLRVTASAKRAAIKKAATEAPPLVDSASIWETWESED